MKQDNSSIKYLDWLLDRVGFRRKGYFRLMYTLLNIPFEAVLDRDNNRIDDGLSLRYEYEQFGITSLTFTSVLEVLISLAIRIEDEYIGEPGESDPEPIFWEMCCNLELEQFTDRFFDEDSVFAIIEGWLSRDFSYDGEGSIFPIKNPIQDQRKIEIWSQMQEYLSENYS